MRTCRTWAGLAAAVLVMSGLALAGAGPATADQVWHQAVGRASAEAACPESSPTDLATGWTAWRGSWEQWANHGTGGFTCTRSIIWAVETPPASDIDVPAYPSGGCIRGGGGTYVDFNGGWYVDVNSPLYTDALCAGPASVTNDLVYAPAPYDAMTLCLDAFGRADNFSGPYGDGIYECNRYI